MSDPAVGRKGREGKGRGPGHNLRAHSTVIEAGVLGVHHPASVCLFPRSALCRSDVDVPAAAVNGGSSGGGRDTHRRGADHVACVVAMLV